MAKASKAKLERYLNSRPGVRKTPGYFDDDGNFVRGPFYLAKLGSEVVALHGTPGYDAEIGFYITREDALNGARALKEKAKQWLAEGNYE